MTLTFQTPGYEHLELSTQVVIAEALKRGLQVEILDPSTQFIRLSDGERTEYIQEATRTSADSYITSLILGNKRVSKILLQEHGISVPKGTAYDTPETALDDYQNPSTESLDFTQGRWVVKPQSTNFGIGISLLPENVPQPDFAKAVDMAFSHDSSILIERFIPGIECRFLVIGDETVAVLNRVPANVTGDGQHTIEELVTLKNKDPRRGKGYKTPLEFLQLGSIEKNELQTQGLTPSDIPPKDKTILLRQNSNISTGGDSIDYTDRVHPSYKQIALQAAQAVNAQICGVDMILNEPNEVATPSNHAIIELNYNPVLYFHDFPYEGKNRKTGQYVLNLLGF